MAKEQVFFKVASADAERDRGLADGARCGRGNGHLNRSVVGSIQDRLRILLRKERCNVGKLTWSSKKTAKSRISP